MPENTHPAAKPKTPRRLFLLIDHPLDLLESHSEALTHWVNFAADVPQVEEFPHRVDTSLCTDLSTELVAAWYSQPELIPLRLCKVDHRIRNKARKDVARVVSRQYVA